MDFADEIVVRLLNDVGLLYAESFSYSCYAVPVVYLLDLVRQQHISVLR
jgi:hypothetical protein